jgi:HAD superfamily hydrolase (TIGR01662 family)
MRTVRGLLFDLGSTLWQKVQSDVWKALETAANVRAGMVLSQQVGTDDVLPMDYTSLGASLRGAIAEATHRAHDVAPDDEPDFAELTRQALETLLRRPVERGLGGMVFEALRIRAPGSRLLFDDAVPTLKALRARGYTVGVVTNRAYGGEIFMEDLRLLELLPFFAPGAIAISADLGIRKPNPAMFLHALRGLALPAEQVAMIGDNLVADVWGAQRAEVLAVWKPSPKLRAAAGGVPEPFTQSEEANAHLVSWAQRQAHIKDPRTLTMAPPDAVIGQLSDLLAIFPGVS